MLARGAAINRTVFTGLADAARAEGIDVQIQAVPAMTGTDADAVRMSRAGVAVGLVSIANRYMHSPNQLVSIADVDQTADVIASYLSGLTESMDLTG